MHLHIFLCEWLAWTCASASQLYDVPVSMHTADQQCCCTRGSVSCARTFIGRSELAYPRWHEVCCLDQGGMLLNDILFESSSVDLADASERYQLGVDDRFRDVKSTTICNVVTSQSMI